MHPLLALFLLLCATCLAAVLTLIWIAKHSSDVNGDPERDAGIENGEPVMAARVRTLCMECGGGYWADVNPDLSWPLSCPACDAFNRGVAGARRQKPFFVYDMPQTSRTAAWAEYARRNNDGATVAVSPQPFKPRPLAVGCLQPPES
jgi:hypothetical protein